VSYNRDNNNNKTFTRDFNSRKRDDGPKKEEHFLDFFKPGVEVRNGDVGKALRILKKRLEKAEFQKTMSKLQYFEKPSQKRKRMKDQAIKRWSKEVRDMEISGAQRQYEPTGTKWMKDKRKKRKHALAKAKLQVALRKKGPFHS
jgi:small subunit ribosomal protein S21